MSRLATPSSIKRRQWQVIGLLLVEHRLPIKGGGECMVAIEVLAVVNGSVHRIHHHACTMPVRSIA